jgi:hypothetical protein
MKSRFLVFQDKLLNYWLSMEKNMFFHCLNGKSQSILIRMLFATVVSLAFVFGVSADSFGAESDPFVGSRTYTLRSDDNIGDGLQVYTHFADATISTNDGLNYSLDFTNPDMMPLVMVRNGDWLKLQSPQTFSPASDMLEAAIVSDGSGGAMILYTQDTAPGSSPDDRSISYSVWSDFAGPITAADNAGQWDSVTYEHWNLLAGGVFFEFTEVGTITSLGGDRFSSYLPSQGIFILTIVGNELIFDNKPWHDGRFLVTQDHTFHALIGVEDYNPTDISLGLGYSTRIPQPSDFNIDGSVNMRDFGGLFGSWKLSDGDVGYDDRFDLSDNDIIDVNDLIIFSADWLGTISDHVLRIEMSTTYDFGDVNSVPVEYQFNASMQVDDTVDTGTIQTPGGIIYPAVMEVNEGENWLGISEKSSLLSDLADFTEGFYIFTVNYTNGTTASTAVLYALEGGSPIPPVDKSLNATYPLNNAIDIPLTIDVQLVALSDPNWTYSVEWVPVIDNPLVLSGVFEQLPYTTTTVGPVNLSPATEYKLNLTADHAIWSTNPDGISYVIDKDSERSIIFTTVSVP